MRRLPFRDGERERGHFRGSTWEHRGSRERAAREYYVAVPGQCRGEAGGIHFRLPPSRSELSFMLFYCLDSATSNRVLLKIV